MNERQKAFVYALLKDPLITAGQAATNVGYSAKTADQSASRLLKDVKVVEALRIGREAMAKEQQITLNDLVQEMRQIAFATIPDMIEWNDSNLRIAFSDKIKAIESLGKMLGLIVDKSDITIRRENPALNAESRVLKRVISEPEE